MLYFVIIFTIIYSGIAIKRLDWAVMFLLALLPTYQIRFDVLGVPMTLLEEMIFIAFAVWLIRNYKLFLKMLKKD